MDINWNVLLSVVTGATALLALFQTQKQIRLSNKQNLLNSRVENYLITDGLIKLYEENRGLFSDKTKLTETINYKFNLMTNSSFLESFTSVIDKPLDNPKHKEFP